MRSRLVRQARLLLVAATCTAGMTAIVPAAPVAAAGITVTTAADADVADSACSLREAITAANTDLDYHGCTAGFGADVISFHIPALELPCLGSACTLVLGSPLPPIAAGSVVTIDGSAQPITLSGNHAVRMMSVVAGGTLTVRRLTFINGRAGNGGAITSLGTVTVADSIFAFNDSPASSGALYSDFGGHLTIQGSTFYANSSGSAGGAVGSYDNTTLSVTNSTFVANAAAGLWGGGAIYARSIGTTATVTGSTFVGNSAGGNGGALGNGGNGEIGATMTVKNSLFANNLAAGTPANCHNEGGTLVDGGYNLEDANTCGFTGTSVVNTNPKLKLPLAANGGPTWTVALESNSPAIDRIPKGTNGCGTTLSADQRGIARPKGLRCDVGAFEYVRVELAKNGGLNSYTGAAKVPVAWLAHLFASTDGKSTAVRKEGAAAVRIAGAAGKTKTLIQNIVLTGAIGDRIAFSYWARGASIPTAGVCSGKVILYNGPLQVASRSIACTNGTHGFAKKSVSFTAPSPYTSASILLTYAKSKGTVWLDLISLTR
jgi:CSLREA domain-containing protein